MAGMHTQEWDVVVELDEQPLRDQVSSFMTSVFMGASFRLPDVLPGGVTARLLAPRPGFIPGVANQISVNIVVTFSDNTNGYYVSRGNIEVARITSQDQKLVVLNFRGSTLEVDPNPPTDSLINPDHLTATFRTALTTSIQTALVGFTTAAGFRTPIPAIALSAPVPTGFDIFGLVVTDPMTSRRAFKIFTRLTGMPVPDPGPTAPIHLQGPALGQSAVLIRNQFLISTILCPSLNTVPPAPFTIPGTMTPLSSGAGFVTMPDGLSCASTMRMGIMGAPTFLILTSMRLTINDASEQFNISGTFELTLGPSVWATGTLSMSFGIRWNPITSRVEIAGNPETTANVNIHAWVWLVAALVFAVLFGLIGAAAGPVGVVIGAVVGAAFGLAAVATLQGITSVIARAATSSTAEMMIGRPMFPLPLLAPSRLVPQLARLDDLVVAGRIETASARINENLIIRDREILSASGFGVRVSLSWQGELEVVVNNLSGSANYVWRLNGTIIDHEGNVAVSRGNLHYRVSGRNLFIQTTIGTFLNEMLSVEVRTEQGFSIFSDKLLQVPGERIELEEINIIDPYWGSGLIRFPPNLFPDPPDIFFDPASIAQIQTDYIQAIETGMGIKIESFS